MTKYIEKYKSEELKEFTLTSNISNYKIIITFIVSFIIIAIIISSLIKYPEKIIGKVFIMSKKNVNNLYSPNSGDIILKIKENSNVEKGDLLALINNPTSYEDLTKLKIQLNTINIENEINYFEFDKTLKLGEVEKYYHNFLLALKKYSNILKIDLTGQKIVNIKNKISRNLEKIEISDRAKNIAREQYNIFLNSFNIDSVLFDSNSIVKSQLIESKVSILNSKQKKINLDKNQQDIVHHNKELEDEAILLNKERERAKANALFNVKKTFFELKTALDLWEYSYTVKAPVSGKIEFYQPFINSIQYVRKDTPLFIILPKIDTLFAKAIMTAIGYGKIRRKDSVFIKLYDYPYKEYGELKGVVHKKSKVYHDSVYYIDIKLINGLKTTYNKTVNYSYNMSGQVEYFTNKRSILQRIFSEIQNSSIDAK